MLIVPVVPACPKLDRPTTAARLEIIWCGSAVAPASDLLADLSPACNQALGALSLALALNSSAYYAEAYTHYKEYQMSDSQAVLNWDSKIPAVYMLFNQAATARPNLAVGAGLSVNRTGWQTEMERYLDNIINGKTRGYFTNGTYRLVGGRCMGAHCECLHIGGLLWYDGDSDQASLNPALNAAMIAARYAPLASSGDKTSSYNVSRTDHAGDSLFTSCSAVGLCPVPTQLRNGQEPNEWYA